MQASTNAPAVAPRALPASGGGAQRLIDQHKAAIAGGDGGKRGRPPGSKNKAPGATAVVSAAPLPPPASLSAVMSSATGLFYATHAAISGDPDWLVDDAIKKEMGDVLSNMLADDFYKVGGMGKYIVGGVLFLSVYAGQAARTAEKRKLRKLLGAVEKNTQSRGAGPRAAAPTPTPVARAMPEMVYPEGPGNPSPLPPAYVPPPPVGTPSEPGKPAEVPPEGSVGPGVEVPGFGPPELPPSAR